jgi:hydroxymethylglutaryl-CoA reductase
MSLHARSIAIAAGAVAEEVEAVASGIVELGRVTLEAAQHSLQKLRGHR